MPKTRKTWREKLDTANAKAGKLVDCPRGTGRMLIPRPLDIDALVRRVPRGKLITVNQLRDRLARDSGADFTCPLTTGIFLRIAAEAAEENRSLGAEGITPYWRVVKADGSLNKKFPGGTETQAARLREEGHTIEVGKGPLRVKDLENSLQKL